MPDPPQSNADAAAADATPNSAGEVSLIPAIMAAGALVLMLLLIVCAVGTWFLFSQRAELAARTIRGTLIPMVEQSTLEPQEKTEVLEELELVAEQCEANVLEGWQAGGIMQRLRMVPIVQWGDLDALAQITVERDWSQEEISNVRRQIARVKRGVETNEIRATDIDMILEPITKPVDDLRDRVLDFSLTDEQIRDTAARLERLADEANIPDRDFDPSLVEIVRDQIAAGKSEGAL